MQNYKHRPQAPPMNFIYCPSCKKKLYGPLIDVIAGGGELVGAGGIQCDCGRKIPHSEILEEFRNVVLYDHSDLEEQLKSADQLAEKVTISLSIILELGLLVFIYFLWWGVFSSWPLILKFSLSIAAVAGGARLVFFIMKFDVTNLIKKLLALGWIVFCLSLEIWLISLVWGKFFSGWFILFKVIFRFIITLIFSIILLFVCIGFVSVTFPKWLEWSETKKSDEDKKKQ